MEEQMTYAGFENYAENRWDGYEKEVIKVRKYHETVISEWKEMKAAGKERAWLRKMCREDLYFLLVYVLGRTDMSYMEDRNGERIERPWLFERCSEVQRNPDGYLDIWARDHYKSTIITYAKTIQDILIDPEITVCIYAYNVGLAQKMLKQIKNTFESCGMLKQIFPDILYKDEHQTGWKDSKGDWHKRKWSEEAITVKRKGNPKEATLECSGLVEGQRTGGHYNLLIYDDTVTIDSVRTKEQIRKTTEAFFMSLNTGSSGNFRMRMIGTRYSLYDTYYDILSKGDIKARVYPAYFLEDNELTERPVLYTKTLLDFKRQNSAYGVFETQMLCNPMADISNNFLPEWIEYTDDLSKRMNIDIICDPAGSTKTRSDYTVFWVVGRTEDDEYILIDIVRDKIDLEQKWSTIRALHTQYTRDGRKPRVFYEQVSMQSDLQHFNYRMAEESSYVEMIPVSGKPKLNPQHMMSGVPLKDQRIGALIPLFKMHRVKFYRSGPRYSHFEKREVDMLQQFIDEEFLSYPFSKHDDGLDCMSRIADLETGIMLTKPDKAVIRKPMKASQQMFVESTRGYIPY